MNRHDAVARLGPYRLESLLGRGGMGEVFLAWDERLERQVAVKRVRRGDTASAAWRERFLREARATARLNHPAIVQIYDFVALEDDGAGSADSAIVLEYVEGRPLSQILAAGPLPESFALELAREIAGGLAAAHAAGIVHRDLKAGNVLVTRDGHAKILDFGLARPAISPETEEPLTESGQVLGTFHAMSPEQAGGGEVDARSDLFSFGVLLYEMLAGVSPFRGANALATLRRVMHEAPAPLAGLRPDLPPALTGLVHRLLSKDRDGRPASIAAVAEELAALSPSRPMGPRPGESTDDLPTGPLPTAALVPVGSGSDPAPPSTAMAPPRPRQLAWLAGAVVAAALGFAGYLGLKPPPAPLRLAVPPPAFDPAASERLALAASGVHSALLSGLAALEGLAPLDPSQIGDAQGPEEMARAAAADEVLLTSLADEGDLARLSLRRVAADGRVLWSEEMRLPTAPGDLLLAADAVEAYLRQAYPGHPPRPGFPDLRVAAGDYAELLAIRRQMEEGKVAVAPLLARAERLAQSSPRFLEAQLLGARLAWSLYQNTRDVVVLDRAGSFAARAGALSPGDPRPLKESFRIALERGRPEDAGELLAGIARLQPGDPEVLVLSAELAARRGQTAEALADLRQAVQRAPSWRNLFALARLEYGSGELAAAREHFGELLARSPDNQWGLGKLAEMELMLGDPRRAEELYRRLIALAPQRAHYTNLGLALSLAGRPADAVAAYREALAIDPGHVTVRLNLADALLALGRSHEAEALYGEVLADFERRAASAALEPTEEMAVAQCLAHLGRPREAVEIVQRTRERHPGHPEVVYLASLVYAVVGDRASALVNAKSALDTGTQPRWFTLPVFGDLRRDPELVALLAGSGSGNPPR